MGEAKEQSTQAWRALYPFDTRFVDVGGCRMHLVDDGAGAPPVVMLHGNPTWSFYYRTVIAGLRDHRRVIAPDHIGCGLSDKPQDYPYTLAQHIDNLDRLLVEELALERVSLIVHDWGGAIGLGWAVRHPERIEKLIILNTAAFLLPDCPLRIRLCRAPLLGPLLVRGGNAFARAALRMATAQPGGLAPAVRAGLLAPYDSYRNRIAHLRFVQDIPLSPQHRSWATVRAIEAKLQLLEDKPIMICWGDRDFCFNHVFLDTWRQIFPKAAVHRFPDAGHYILEDAGDAVTALARDFLVGPASAATA